MIGCSQKVEMIMTERITVESVVDAPLDRVWEAYTSPRHIKGWNFASDDWHCPSASADLREGGSFSSRMEAKDGSAGFDFEGIYTRIIENERIEYRFGDRHAEVDFVPQQGRVVVRVTFDPESEFPLDQQRAGWQSILDNFTGYAASVRPPA